MARIPLRNYHHEIDQLIDRGQIEEAIAHSKIILKQFPKDVETYRLLGKAYLESQRYSEAADILQRLLSVVPDDFVSQLGMSVIREDEGNLDAAIWHMERAYEVQPFNHAVQDELRRLYGRRDGAEPPRIRLTRGSLVRMYARGELHSQAIAEARGAIAEDPQRIDLQALLAQMYFLSGQKVEAAEMASALIAKLPYCLEANRILMDILPATSRAEEARNFKRRVCDLDPYTEFITPNNPTSAQVPDQAVMVERVDWQPTEQDNQTPDWTRTIGVAWQENKEEENLPDWLNSIAPPTAVQPETQLAPAPQDDILPDFMRDAGWSPSRTPVDESSSSQFSPEEVVETSDAGLEQAEIPDWLREMAPKTGSDQQAPESEDDELGWINNILPPGGNNGLPEPDQTTGAALPSALPLTPASRLPATADPIPGNLSTPLPDILDWSTPPPSPASDRPATAPESFPDWLTGFGDTSQTSTPAESQDELPPEAPPAWLSQAQNEKDEFAWVPEEPSHPSNSDLELPDWLKDEPSNTAAGIVQPAWLGEVNPAEPLDLDQAKQRNWDGGSLEAQIKGLEPSQEPVDDSVSDWLSNLKAAQEEEAEALPLEQPGVHAEPESQNPLPDWLSTFDGEQNNLSAPLEDTAFPIGNQEELPAWLPEEQVLISQPSTDQVPSQLDTSGSTTDEIDIDSAMAWLEGLAAKQGADAGTLKITTPDQRTETPPEWLSGYAQPDLSTTPEPTSNPDEEIPDWLASQEAALASKLPALPHLDLAEPPAELAIHTQDSPVEPSTAVETDISDIDAALAWMEALAAKQGADADSLKITPLESRSETPPEWIASIEAQGSEIPNLDEPDLETVKNSDDAAPGLGWLPVEEIQDAGLSPESIQASELPDWLKELQTQEEFTPAGEVVALPTAETASQLPDWLERAADSSDGLQADNAATVPAAILSSLEETNPAISPEAAPNLDDMDSALAWLEGLAAKQGADEDSLKITAPENRTETPPEWISNLTGSSPEPAVNEPLPTEWISSLTGIAAEPAVDEALPTEELTVADVKLPLVTAVEPVLTQVEIPPTAAPPPQASEPADTEIPDWLLNYEQEQSQKAQAWEIPAVAQPIPAQASAADDSLTIWLKRHHPDTGELKSPGGILPEVPGLAASSEGAASGVEGTPLEKAQAAISKGYTGEAALLYSQVIETGQDLDTVINDLNEALYRHPVDFDLWQTLGDAQIRANRVQEALDAYTKAEELLR